MNLRPAYIFKFHQDVCRHPTLIHFLPLILSAVLGYDVLTKKQRLLAISAVETASNH